MIDEFLKFFGIIFVIFMLVKFKFPHIINVMVDIENFIENIPNNVSDQEEQDVENKRKRLISMLEQGKTSVFPGKTKWTVARLQKASNNRIETLYNNMSNKNIQVKSPKKDFFSKLFAMSDFPKFQAERESNFLTSSNMSLPNLPAFEYFPTELLLASIYEKSTGYLPIISLLCQAFNALDWEIAAEICEKRQKEREQEEELKSLEQHRLLKESNIINGENGEVNESEASRES